MNNNNNKTEIATLANGCFWCTEAIFGRVKGVKSISYSICNCNYNRNALFSILFDMSVPYSLTKNPCIIIVLIS
jgi:peptide methionine sulfoxide reductase MsrA